MVSAFVGDLQPVSGVEKQILALLAQNKSYCVGRRGVFGALSSILGIFPEKPL